MEVMVLPGYSCGDGTKSTNPRGVKLVKQAKHSAGQNPKTPKGPDMRCWNFDQCFSRLVCVLLRLG